MVKASTKKVLSIFLVYGGAITVAFMHIPIVASSIPTSVSRMHGLINLGAAIGIMIGAWWGKIR